MEPDISLTPTASKVPFISDSVNFFTKMATEFISNHASSALFDTVVAHRPSTDVRLPYMVTLIAVILVFAASAAKIFRPSPFPLINGRNWFELTSIRQKKEFMAGAWDIVLKGLKHAAGKPFRVVADVGEVIILPPKYAYEIRNRQDMPSALATFKVFPTDRARGEAN